MESDSMTSLSQALSATATSTHNTMLKRSKEESAKGSSSKRKQSTPVRVISSEPVEEDAVAMETVSNHGSLNETGSMIEFVRDDPSTTSMVVVQGTNRHIPIHCMVEVSTGNFNEDGSLFYQLELDDFTLVPHDLAVSKLPKAALIQLGYGFQHAMTVTGYIQVMNWKPLTLESITDDPQVSVAYLFANLSNVAILRIQITSHPIIIRPISITPDVTQSLGTPSPVTSTSPPSPAELPTVMNDIKDKLDKLLQSNKMSVLVSHGCPFSQAVISQIIQGKYLSRISSDKAKAFYKWYEIYTGLSKGAISQPVKKKPSGYRRTRTLFDPKEELPRLRRWFRDDPRPSREQMLLYLYELNHLERRKKGTPLQFSSILLWFKNARAKYKTNDVIFPTQGLSQNDYPLSSHHRRILPKGNEITSSNHKSSTHRVSQGETSLSSHHRKILPKMNEQTIGCSKSVRSSHPTLLQVETQCSDAATRTPTGLLVESVHHKENRTLGIFTETLVRGGSGEMLPDMNRSTDSVVSDSTPVQGIKGEQKHTDPMTIADNIIETATVAEALFGRRKRHRFSIHPLYEVPKLKAWFVDNPRPDYATKERIMMELNSSPFRVGREHWTVKTVTVWFKNARAKMYRNELFNENEKTSPKMETKVSSTPTSTLSGHTSQKVIFPVSIAKALSSTPKSTPSSSSVTSSKPVKSVAMDTHSERKPEKSNSTTAIKEDQQESTSDPMTPRLTSVTPRLTSTPNSYSDTVDLMASTNSDRSPSHPNLTSLLTQIKKETPESNPETVMSDSVSMNYDDATTSGHHGYRDLSSSSASSSLTHQDSSHCEDINNIEHSQNYQEPEKVFQINASFELPKLKKWFQENPTPTTELVDMYVQTLNSVPFRQFQSQKYNSEILTAWFDLERQKCFTPNTMPTEQQDIARPDSNSSSLSSEYTSDIQTEWTDLAVRNAITEVLKEINQSQLGQISPLTQSMISCIVNGKYTATISKEKCQEFGTWYEQYRQSKSQHQEPPRVDKVPRYLRYMPGRKLSFHPQHEVPKMRDWFDECRHPTDAQLQQYSDIMNAHSFRQHTGRPITVTNLRVWWKNERAKRNREARDVRNDSGSS